MLKKCTLLWREAHLEVKVLQTAAFEPILMELLKLVQLVKFVELGQLISYLVT